MRGGETYRQTDVKTDKETEGVRERGRVPDKQMERKRKVRERGTKL